MTIRGFTLKELDLLVDALRRAAARQESQARYNPRAAKRHDTKAEKFRKLITKIYNTTGPANADF